MPPKKVYAPLHLYESSKRECLTLTPEGLGASCFFVGCILKTDQWPFGPLVYLYSTLIQEPISSPHPYWGDDGSEILVCIQYRLLEGREGAPSIPSPVLKKGTGEAGNTSHWFSAKCHPQLPWNKQWIIIVLKNLDKRRQFLAYISQLGRQLPPMF